jgi:hypothetical protein
MVDLIHELEKFNNIFFIDTKHRYYHKGIKDYIPSVSKILGKYSTFDQEKVLSKYTEEERQAKLAQWDLKRKYGLARGNAVHNYLEHLWDRKFFPIFYETFDHAHINIRYINEVNDCIKNAKKFYLEYREVYYPIAQELVVGDTKLAGTIDLLAYNKLTNSYALIDYKTDEKFTTSSYFKFGGSISDLDNSKLNKYSLQLAMYKYLVEKQTNIKIEESFIIHISKDGYKVIDTKDFDDYAKLLYSEI